MSIWTKKNFRRKNGYTFAHINFKQIIMARNKLLCIGLILLSALSCFAETEEIKFIGEWKKVKSIIPQLPIRAWIEDNNKDLLLEFSSNLGSIEVIVTNSTGDIIHMQSVDTKITSSTIISLNEEVKQGDQLFITDRMNTISGNLLPIN